MINALFLAKVKAKIAKSSFLNFLITHTAIITEKYFFIFHFSSEKYLKSQWINNAPEFNEKLSQAEKCIYVFWTGKNEMSDNRKKGLEMLEEKTGIEIKLITPDNLDEYILQGFPLHPSYQYLSLVHKSDYLRCYFMYHYGGGYSDVKSAKNNWNKAFELLNKSDSYVLGYREILGGISRVNNDDVLSYDLRRYYFKNIGVCSFIFKPKSPIAKEWLDELHRRLDVYIYSLKNNPGNIMGDNEGYPIQWTLILGQVLHPIFLKYHKKVIQDDNIRPSFSNYR